MKSLLFLSLFLSLSVHAFDFLPESRHHQSLTYALFTEEQMGAVKLSGSSLWVPVGGSFTVFEMDTWRWKPQFVITGLAKAWMEQKSDSGLLLPQTIDAHAGASVDLELAQDERMSIGIYHLSGHAADEVIDKTLLNGNVGNEYIFVRYIRDFANTENAPTFRVGGTFKPVLGSDPATQRFAADQFIEWYPFAGSRDPKKGSFYATFGVEESGMKNIRGSYHVQLGYAFGDHFARTDGIHASAAARLVLGYYTGNDPRLKYYELREGRTKFMYGGVMVNL